MTPTGESERDKILMHQATEVTIRLVLVVGLGIWCFLIFKPFLMPVMWGIVLAVALNPMFDRLKALLGGRNKLAGTLFIVVGIGALLVPAFLVSESFFDGMRWLSTEVQKDSIQVPPPPAGVKDWPVIGDGVFEVWTGASENLDKTLAQFRPQIRAFGAWLLSTLTGLGFGLLVTCLSIAIAGVMLMNSEGGERTARALGERLGGDQGVAAIDLSIKTIRSVATGVVGVAAIQAGLAAIGMFAAGIPGAGLWAVLILILAVAQLPPILIMGPAMLYLFATSDSTVTMVLFTIWAVMVSVSDGFLKPLLLGRGLDIPMPVILIGAIGGMLLNGIIGLFVGAVVLAIGYKLLTAWMKETEEVSPDNEAPSSTQ